MIRVLGLIPARGGSKGLPRKNIRLLGEKPLLQYTVESAAAAQLISRVILSTDDEEIAEIGRHLGLEVPFIRPEELAQDDTPMLAVAQHAVRFVVDEGDDFDALCILQPSSPFRRPQIIDACIELLARKDADAVVTILPVPSKYNPHWVYFKDENGLIHLSTGSPDPIPRRQDLLPAFHREGSVYVARKDVVLYQNSLYGNRLLGYLVTNELSVSIDTPEDWKAAERLLKRIEHERGDT